MRFERPVNLSTGFVAVARDGDWLEASATVNRAGRRLAFAHGIDIVDGEPVAKTSAVFAVS